MCLQEFDIHIYLRLSFGYADIFVWIHFNIYIRIYLVTWYITDLYVHTVQRVLT